MTCLWGVSAWTSFWVKLLGGLAGVHWWVWGRIALCFPTGSAGHCAATCGGAGNPQWLWNRGEEIQTGTAEECLGDVSIPILGHCGFASEHMIRKKLYCWCPGQVVPRDWGLLCPLLVTVHEKHRVPHFYSLTSKPWWSLSQVCLVFG